MSRLTALKQNTEYHRAYARGKSSSNPLLVTYALKNRGLGCRVGITTSKKIGSAVERNRCRRIIRAAYAMFEGELSGNWDLVFVARYKTKSVKSTAVAQVMYDQLVQLGVIRKS